MLQVFIEEARRWVIAGSCRSCNGLSLSGYRCSGVGEAPGWPLGYPFSSLGFIGHLALLQCQHIASKRDEAGA